VETNPFSHARFFAMKRPPKTPNTTSKARELRRNSTKPESLLWSVLRGGRLGGLKFRRQHPVGPFVADFYCHSAKLVVEVDGMTHDQSAEYDQRRTEYLQRQGLRVIRVINDDVLGDLEAVARYIAGEAGVRID
jgi:very-short-patch-repair endonuclease